MFTKIVAAVSLTGILAVGGCGGSTSLTTTASTAAEPRLFDRPRRPTADFRLGPCRSNNQRAGSSGRKISTPLVEDLQAAGRSPTPLARDIERVLGQYVCSPVVTVIVQNFVGETHSKSVWWVRRRRRRCFSIAKG